MFTRTQLDKNVRDVEAVLATVHLCLVSLQFTFSPLGRVRANG